jgi:general secretion pathway protein J
MRCSRTRASRRKQHRGAARKRTGGFTLVELLVAITVLAIVAVLGWRGLDGIVRARIALNSNMEQTRGMQLAFAQMQSDCSHIVRAALIPDHAPLRAEDGRLMLIRHVFDDNQPSRLQVVVYRLRDGVLTRRESTATRDLTELDKLWLSAANGTDAAQEVVLQSDVAAMKMRLWDGTGWRASPSAAAMPSAASAAATAGAATSVQPDITGLEVALQLRGRESSMLKVFLLGAA